MIPQPITGKLSKKFLMSLPEGVYLASGVGEAPGQPSFGEKVVSLPEREGQWQRVKSAGADGRQCGVFENAEDYVKYSLTIQNYDRGRN